MAGGGHDQNRLTLETTQEETWAELHQFYDKNHTSIERSINLNVAQGQFQEHLDQVLETSQVLLDGLVALANVHPVVGLAVFAFHGMIKLDITRRENNRKVLAVKLQMQSMMSAMFQMCELKHVHVLNEPQKATQRAQLQELVKAIAEEIKQCGSDLNYYSDRKIVSKLIKAKIYERRFAGHVETFAQRRSELQTTISAYISAGIDAANIAIGQVGQKVEVMDKKIDSLLSVFQRLDTASERELLKIIEDNGAENCINTDNLLQMLLTKSGQSTDSLADARKTLRAELSEDLDKVLSQNLNRFEKLLVIQNNNLERLSSQIEQQGLGINDQSLKIDKLINHSILILEEGRLIKKAVGPNTRIKLKDPELQRIWDRMGLSGRGSVKAKQFVLTFRDYLIASDRSVLATPEPLSALSLEIQEPPSPLSFPVPQEPTQLTIPDESDSDAWVLKHINVTHVQPIIEAIDQDGSGFISVQEANKFALSRPSGIKLLHWIAYWAAGWHYNVIDYRSKIYRVMQELHAIAANVLSVNRKLTDLYMDDFHYFRVEGILRRIQPLPEDMSRDPPLAELATSIATTREERLKKNLEELSYVLRSPADVTLVIGSGRLETSLLPLLYLLLDRHLAVLKIAQTRVLSSLEFMDHRISLQSIFSIYDERMRRLQDIFRQVNHDTELYCSNFAYGMFLESYKRTPGVRIAGGNTLLEFHDDTTYDSQDDAPGTTDASKDNGPGENAASNPEDVSKNVSKDDEEPNLTILTRGVQDPLSAMQFMISDDLNSFDENEASDDIVSKPPPQDYVPHGIEGRWVGIFENNAITPFECVVQPIVDGRLIGKGRDYADPCKISGLYNDQTGVTSFEVTYPIYTPIRFKGSYNESRDRINGWWSSDPESSAGIVDIEDFPQTPGQTFAMTRHSNAAFRFRDILDDPEEGATLAGATIAKRRWAFAIEAVRFDVQARLGSWDFMRRRIAERDEWHELHTRDLELSLIFRATRGFVTTEQTDRWFEVRSKLHPSIAALYFWINRNLEERWWWDCGSMICDICRQTIVFKRYMCMTCVADDYSTWADFCVDSNCSEVQDTVNTTDFLHSRSHTLLRCTERIYTYQLPTIVSQVRLRSEKIKNLFRENSAATGGIRGVRKTDKLNHLTDTETPTNPLVCSSCSSLLTLPCWACAVCTLEILLCLQCEKNFETPLKHRGAMPDGHSSRHNLMRISDSLEEKVVKLGSHQKELNDMERKITQGLHALEEYSEDRINALEQKLDSRLGALESKVDALMSLMQQVLSAGEQRQNN